MHRFPRSPGPGACRADNRSEALAEDVLIGPLTEFGVMPHQNHSGNGRSSSFEALHAGEGVGERAQAIEPDHQDGPAQLDREIREIGASGKGDQRTSRAFHQNVFVSPGGFHHRLRQLAWSRRRRFPGELRGPGG